MKPVHMSIRLPNNFCEVYVKVPEDIEEQMNNMDNSIEDEIVSFWQSIMTRLEDRIYDEIAYI